MLVLAVSTDGSSSRCLSGATADWYTCALDVPLGGAGRAAVGGGGGGVATTCVSPEVTGRNGATNAGASGDTGLCGTLGALATGAGAGGGATGVTPPAGVGVGAGAAGSGGSICGFSGFGGALRELIGTVPHGCWTLPARTVIFCE